MGLERLGPPPAERAGPASVPAGRRDREAPTGERSKSGAAGSGRGSGAASGRPRKAKTWPTREQREQRAEATAAARAAEIAKDPPGFARQACLLLLEHGPRTRKELAAALAAKGVPAEAAAEVLGRFAEVGIIDDALFARMWVTSRHRGRGLSGRALSQELRRKGVDDELVREAVDELDPEQEAETARALVRRRLPATRGLATQARIRRLAGMLARKGYSGGLAFRIVKEELDREGLSAGDSAELSFDALQSLED